MHRRTFLRSSLAVLAAGGTLRSVPIVAAAYSELVAVRPFPGAALADAAVDIQRLIDKAGRSGGGIVVVPPGSHWLNRPLEMRSNVRLYGGELASSGWAFITVGPDVHDARVEGMKISLSRPQGSDGNSP